MAMLVFSAVHVDTKWKLLQSELLQGVIKKKKSKVGWGQRISKFLLMIYIGTMRWLSHFFQISFQWRDNGDKSMIRVWYNECYQDDGRVCVVTVNRMVLPLYLGARFAAGCWGRAGGTVICKLQNHEKRLRNMMKIFQLNLAVLFE